MNPTFWTRRWRRAGRTPVGTRQGPGPEGVKPLIRAFREAFPHLRIIVHDVIADAGRIGVRAEISGIHAGVWFNVPPSNRRRSSMTLHEFHRIENGRLAHTWHLEDWFWWLNRVGACPLPEENA